MGIDIGVNYILAVVTDLQGNIHNEQFTKIGNLTFEETLNETYSIIDELIVSLPKSPYGVIGIGIGVPGLVKNGRVLMAPNISWKNVDLKKLVEEKYNTPVVIQNEANAGAYGEKKFGAGKPYNDIVYISIGIGIGAGFILNGKLHEGHNGLTGEVGHMTINMNGPLCNCGNKGCWELYASEQSLINMALEYNIIKGNPEEKTLEWLISLAENENEQALKIINKLSDYILVGLNNIINSYNPEQIIIGNRLATLQNWLEEPLKQNISTHPLVSHQKDLQLHFSMLEKKSAALGVSAFVTDSFFSKNQLTN
ncbi:xylose repressor [Alkalibacillus haloalkaliphilus]|uniref:Xylose repressor n=1 Tax=Alkalibacillus haloalkaliphilus TaxID=94136 RepID=A0A511W4R7_9BACI|nr:xylose repressor [Alkalibacillus haloalkaliphilus]